MEVSSRRRPSKLMDLGTAPKNPHNKKFRDPRFDSLSGKLNEEMFHTNYRFVKNYKETEIKKLTHELKREKDPQRKEEIQRALSGLVLYCLCLSACRWLVWSPSLSLSHTVTHIHKIATRSRIYEEPRARETKEEGKEESRKRVGSAGQESVLYQEVRWAYHGAAAQVHRAQEERPVGQVSGEKETKTSKQGAQAHTLEEKDCCWASRWQHKPFQKALKEEEDLLTMCFLVTEINYHGNLTFYKNWWHSERGRLVQELLCGISLASRNESRWSCSGHLWNSPWVSFFCCCDHPSVDHLTEMEHVKCWGSISPTSCTLHLDWDLSVLYMPVSLIKTCSGFP